ncbi:MAG: DUF2200 domain-containing protein [Oscillospiraceae bacterium]|nr:DUF2200 domain-containing protein [Oscillospiraceae bacterium]
MSNDRVYKMKFSKVYPLLVQKVERKGRSKAEVDKVICWLTGYEEQDLQSQLAADVDYEQFFSDAPEFNPNADKITGVICGHRVENITEPLMKKIRQMDKLVDELAKGKTMEKILRA